MKIRGVALLAAKAVVTRNFGAEAWAEFYAVVARRYSCFGSFVTGESLIPLPAYLGFQEELVNRFFAGDRLAHATFGRESARWAAADGPLRSLMQAPDLTRFVASICDVWGLYFADTSSSVEACISGDTIEFTVSDFCDWHPYLEYFVVAHLQELIELFCVNPILAARLSGDHRRGYGWVFRGAPTEPAESERVVSSKPGALRVLAQREAETLRLIADGSTNKEIAEALGISEKTAQHNVARVYRKIGVSNRVSAALWLLQRKQVAR